MISSQDAQARLDELNDLMDLMRPSVQMDGGDLELVSADPYSGVVEIKMVGACSSCAISSVTLNDGVTRLLTERLAWVTQVIGSLDDSLTQEESSLLGQGGYVPKYSV